MSTQSASQARLRTLYPWTSTPLIINGPMATFISPALVRAVTAAHGLGFLGAGYELSGASQRLAGARAALADLHDPALPSDGTLPVGIGILCFAVSVEDVVEMLKEHRPVAVWLFGAPSTSAYAEWVSQIRKACPQTHIWIQTNSVSDALFLAQNATPDVLVLQGADAGGHGAVKSVGIVALLPEAADALEEAGFGHIPLVAAGGLSDARGVAAALALGAAGVTLGTRFLGAEEAPMPDPAYQRALLATRDGGQTTTRSQVFDEVLFPKGNVWPAAYDGRALRNATTRDVESGVGLDEVKTRFAGDRGFKGEMGESRAVAWAGASVGLVRKVMPAAQIVEEVREGAVGILRGLGGKL